MKNEFDFIAIGDIVTDAFIRLKDPSIHAHVNHNTNELCMRFGDKIPYDTVEVIRSVGNSPNAAVSAARLGLNTALISDLGNDDIASESITYLKSNKVDTSFMTLHDGEKSNYHYVLWYEDDRTILVKHYDYPYTLPDFGTPKWIYLSSIGEKSLPYHDAIANYLREHPTIKLAFQPGTFQMKFGTERLKEIYKRTEVFFCNLEEARRILNLPDAQIGTLLQGVYKLGVKIAVITDGPKGAYTYDGKEMWFMPTYPDPKPPLERTGAGDAFASTFASALALGKSIPEALSWGPINSMSVVQDVGAQKGLLSRAKLEEYLMNAPTDYKPHQILN